MRKRFGLRIFVLVVFAGLLSCKSNVICPAFQSTYILDDSLRLLAFSPFGPDSQPKYSSVSRKNKNGIIDHDPYWRKNYALRVVRMENQFLPPPVDSLQFEDQLLVPDSLMVESDSSLLDKPVTSPPSKKQPTYIRKYDPKDKFNQEQEFYNKHFGELFIQKSTPQSQPATDVTPQAADTASTQQEKRGLFNRRKKENVDELPLQPADSTGN